MVGVSTKFGRMEQKRERGEPDTNTNSAGDTVTDGLGTEEEKERDNYLDSYSNEYVSLL